MFNTEYYLCRRDKSQFTSLDLFYFEHNPPVNSQWALMIQRVLTVHSFIFFLDKANRLIPGGTRHFARLLPEGRGSIDPEGLLAQTEPHLNFTSEEERLGQRFLEETGLRQDERFVCLIVRDSAYKNSIHPAVDWSYHDYRDSHIDTYRCAACALAEQGYWVFRMGKAVQDPFQANHPRIIDYAKSDDRNDFLDIWLVTHCEFAITTGTGLDEVCTVFRRKYVHVNQIPVGGTRSFTPSLVTFKQLRWKSSGVPLSLREQIATGSIYALHKSAYDNLGIEIVDNTPEEILEAVLEFEALRTGSYDETREDMELQARFWAILGEWAAFGKYHNSIQATVSPSFLRKTHPWFLA
ncbi:MAG: TIGR04372 family glycosyltransferase [Candidatus Omnitrophica bacterium]|nr:TIGR04372 family glycosyltransferase [Candidatus Omnitrophota bacterium]